MFEVGFSELVLIFGIALVVLGPTRLPGLVSKIGRWVGKARSMARQFREQLESEVQLEELNRITTASTPAKPHYPAPPPEFGGEPIPTSPGIASETPLAAAPETSPAPAEDIDSMIIPPDDPSHRDLSEPEAAPAEPAQGTLPLDGPHERAT